MSADKRNFVDEFESPDFYGIDDLLTEEHKLIRTSVRDFVKKEITPFVEGWAEKNHFPEAMVKKFGEVGAFGPTVPQAYGGGGLDYISYGLIMQEIERGDSGMRSTTSVQGSLVMYPIYAYGSEAQREKVSPEISLRRDVRLLWVDRAQSRFKPRRDGDKLQRQGRPLSPQWC